MASSDAEADGGEGDAAEAGQVAPRGRRARLSARRRESVRLPDGVSGGDVGEFLRHPDGVESLLDTGALQSFATAGAGPGTFTCRLRRIGFLGFEVVPVLELHVAPTAPSRCCRAGYARAISPGPSIGLAMRHFSDSSSSFPPVFYLKEPA